MSFEQQITRENLDACLKEVAKEYKKQTHGSVRAEIILVGGAAVLASYGFREVTNDIDAIIDAESVMRDVIAAVGDRLNLPNGWLNADFKNTSSFSWKLVQHSEHYKTFSNIVEIRTVRAEYLVAMKLKAGRLYKKDMSDVVGILNEQQKANHPLTYEMIDRAVCELYDNWDGIDDYCIDLLRTALSASDISLVFDSVIQQENDAKESVVEINKKYDGLVNEDNVSDIIQKALEKKKSLSQKPKE